MMHRLIAWVTLAAAFVPVDIALAQGTFPAPLPGQPTLPPASESTETCADGFLPLREDAEKKGKLIKAASERHAPPGETCRLIGEYSQAEVKMLKYVEANATKCGIPGRVADQLKDGHKKTETRLTRVCAVAARASGQGRTFQGPAQISDFGDPAFGRAPRF